MASAIRANAAGALPALARMAAVRTTSSSKGRRASITFNSSSGRLSATMQPRSRQDLQQPFAGEPLHRFANRRAADAKLL